MPRFPELSEPHTGLPAPESTKPRVRTARVFSCSDPPSRGGDQGSLSPGLGLLICKRGRWKLPCPAQARRSPRPTTRRCKVGVMATMLPTDDASSGPMRRSGHVQARRRPAPPQRTSNRNNIHKREGGAKVVSLPVGPFLQLKEAVLRPL